MSVDNPVIKFSPFEALLIGEKNKIAKRKPMKNTIFVTHLNQKRKALDLRALFDLKEERRGSCKEDKSLKKKHGKRSEFLRARAGKLGCGESGDKPKSRKNQEIYCYEFEGRKVIVKSSERVKFKAKKKKAQSNKVKFKPDFRFKETLEERIVHKMQKRKKKLNGTAVRNGALNHAKKVGSRKHMLRDKNGKFIRREDYERMAKSERSNLESNCVCRASARSAESSSETTCSANDDNEEIGGALELPKKNVGDSETASDDAPGESFDFAGFPPLPKLEVVDFDDDPDLLDMAYESRPKSRLRFERASDDLDDFSEALRNADIAYPTKGLKMYERKKSSLSGSNNNNNNNSEKRVCGGEDDDARRESFSNSTKENHCVNKRLNVNKMERLGGNGVVALNGRRNGSNYLIDERPTKDNHLLSRKKLRSLFYKTACGSETYLGNLMKPVLLNSPFGRLPDIS